MKRMIAIYTDRNGNVRSIRGEYTTKKDFLDDCIGNGCKAAQVYTEAEIQHIINTDWLDLIDEYRMTKKRDRDIEYIKEVL